MSYCGRSCPLRSEFHLIGADCLSLPLLALAASTLGRRSFFGPGDYGPNPER